MYFVIVNCCVARVTSFSLSPPIDQRSFSLLLSFVHVTSCSSLFLSLVSLGNTLFFSSYRLINVDVNKKTHKICSDRHAAAENGRPEKTIIHSL